MPGPDDQLVAALGKFHQHAAEATTQLTDAAHHYDDLPLAEATRVYATRLRRELTPEHLAAALAYLSLRTVRDGC